MLRNALIDAYATPVPRYTSYPSAPHFHAGIDTQTYGKWLAATPAGASVSLYLHIPFCDRLCWFCACNTKQVQRYDPITAYLDGLIAEIERVGAALGPDKSVTTIHFGGGSPTMLSPMDWHRVNTALRTHFSVAPNAEISIEIDPNDMDAEKLDALAEIGVTRASLGVQDFNPTVQKAINRIQSFAQTREVVVGLRSRGIGAINIDMLYGLPHQTDISVVDTARSVLSLAPDRVALFGYAHVPWMKKHQRMIDEAALPDAHQRFAQAQFAAFELMVGGMVPVGMDHFATPADPLAVAARTGTLRRNFQGYTTDRADVLIGLGASAIGQLPQGHIQNAIPTADYLRAVTAGQFAIVKGYALNHDDTMRGWAIEQIMCRFALSRSAAEEKFGAAAKTLFARADAWLATHDDGLFTRIGDRYEVTPKGKPFVRHIAAIFDAYLNAGTARHSIAV